MGSLNHIRPCVGSLGCVYTSVILECEVIPQACLRCQPSFRNPGEPEGFFRLRQPSLQEEEVGGSALPSTARSGDRRKPLGYFHFSCAIHIADVARLIPARALLCRRALAELVALLGSILRHFKPNVIKAP